MSGPDWDTFSVLAHGDLRVLHIWLYAVCVTHGPAVLAACKVTPEAEREGLEQAWHDAVGAGAAGIVVQVERARAAGSGRLLALAAALVAIDAHHARRPGALLRHPWVPPPHLTADLPGGEWWLLPPEVRQKSGLARKDAGDYRPDVAARLGLACRVIAPVFGCPVKVRFREAPAAVAHALSGASDGDAVVVAMGSPAAGAAMGSASAPERREADGRTPYRFTGIDARDLSGARAVLDQIVAAADGAHVLLLPELEVPPPLLDHLSSALAARSTTLGLVVAGSYHVEADGHFRNRATILTGWGEPLWTHDKLVDFGIPATEAEALAAACPGVLAGLGLDVRGGREDILLGENLVVCDVPFGRLAVLICLDYCGGYLDPLLQAAGVNALFVPAMTSSTRDFEQRAMEMGARAGACAWIANSAWLSKQTGAVALAMAYRPVKGGWYETTAVPDPVNVCSIHVMSRSRE